MVMHTLNEIMLHLLVDVALFDLWLGGCSEVPDSGPIRAEGVAGSIVFAFQGDRLV